jgi:uncharacterized protein YeaO (DUF488 family)
MAIRVVRFGSPRAPDEGVRLGTVRRPPRGVRKEDYAARDFYDVWLPELAPSAPLLAFALAEPFTLKRWAEYDRRYRAEMSKNEPQHLIATLAALSAQANFAVGCYCENEHYCHRSILKKLLAQAGAVIV